MSTSARTLRRVSILLVALVSAACGLFLAFRFVTVDRIGSVSTAHLLGLLGLFVLPALTLVALELDRQATANGARRPSEAKPQAPRGASHPPGREPRPAPRPHARPRVAARAR